ncbi:Putative sugar phosphate/phosphate translocator [Picochlorum sp. SENEW3]|nr:Putative sugar phosphate/phosphate translocator [Picochlorum sp. SENEW3]
MPWYWDNRVLGNAKGVVAVVASVICFRNPVTFYTILGYSITVGGVILYSNAKRQSRKVDALKKLSAAKVSGIEQPSSPFTPSSNPMNTAESRERNIGAI